MTTIGKPPSFNDRWLPLLKFIAMYYPEITSEWETACDHLILKDTGLPIFGLKGNTLRKFARQRITSYKSDRNPNAKYDKSYNPFDHLVEQDKFQTFTINFDKMKSSPKRSPKRSPAKPARGKVNSRDIDLLCDATSSMRVGTGGPPKLTQGINVVDGLFITVNSSMQQLPCGSGLQKVAKVVAQLPQNCINSKTRARTSACLSRGGGRATTIKLGAPLSFRAVAEATDENQAFARKTYVQESDEATKAWDVLGDVEGGDLLEAEECGDLDDQPFILELELPDIKDDGCAYSNRYFNESFNKSTKKRDIPPADDAFLFTLVYIQSAKKAACVDLDRKGATKAAMSMGLVTLMIPIEGPGCFKPMKPTGSDSEDDDDDFYSNMLAEGGDDNDDMEG